MGKLTAKICREIAAPGRYSDGNNLYFVVTKAGSKQWVQRIKIYGKVRDLGLGGFPLVSLAEARKVALKNRVTVGEGGDPRQGKRKVQAPTFAEAAQEVHALRESRWRNENHRRNWLRTLELYAFPRLGALPVDRITRADVLSALLEIWNTKEETARRVRQRIRTVFGHYQALGVIEFNPAGDAISAALPPQSARKVHLRAMPYKAVGEALEAVETERVSLAVQLAFRFLVLTAARSGEVRLARWAEIDEKAKAWVIPAERMKAGREHRVPLSDAAVEVLEQAGRMLRCPEYIFPSPRKPRAPLSDMAFGKMLRDVGLHEATTAHGFRSSFRDWCAETGKAREVAEAALAHVVGGVEGAYFRSDLFDRRRIVMQQWADFLRGTASKVVELRP